MILHIYIESNTRKTSLFANLSTNLPSAPLFFGIFSEKAEIGGKWRISPIHRTNALLDI